MFFKATEQIGDQQQMPNLAADTILEPIKLAPNMLDQFKTELNQRSGTNTIRVIDSEQ